jgi:hypothetical protein
MMEFRTTLRLWALLLTAESGSGAGERISRPLKLRMFIAVRDTARRLVDLNARSQFRSWRIRVRPAVLRELYGLLTNAGIVRPL